MKLHYFQGSCALAPHIVLEWTGADYDLAEIKRSDARGEDYMATVNPWGKVPVLELDDGTKIHQVNALLLWLAEQYPDLNLGPTETQDGRYAMQNLLSYFNGDVHTSFTPYFLTYRFCTVKENYDSVKEAAAAEIEFHLTNIEKHMEGRDWVLEDRRTILDPYLYVFCNWARFVPKPLKEYPNLAAFAKRMMADDGVQGALKKQGLA